MNKIKPILKCIPMKMLVILLLLTITNSTFVSINVDLVSKCFSEPSTTILALYIISTAIDVLSYYGNFLYIRHIELVVQKTLQTKLYEKCMKLPHSFFTNNEPSAVLSIFESIYSISASVRFLWSFISSILILITISISLYMINILFVLPVILSCIFIVVIVKRNKDTVNNIFDDTHVVNRKINLLLNDTLRGFELIKTYGMEESLTNNMTNLINRAIDNKTRSRNLVTKTDFSVTSIIAIVQIIIVMIAIILTDNGYSFNGLTVILLYTKIVSPMSNLVWFIDDAMNSLNKYDKYHKLMNEPEEVTGDICIDSIESVTFKDVSFKYDVSNNKVLDDMRFTINKGEHIGIVGSSGCGKSTMIKLILGFLYPDSGAVLINNINSKALSMRSLRSHIALVDQENIIFSGSIIDNIKVEANSNISDDNIKDICDAVGLKDLIESLPDGYNTFIGYNGIKLSGGQKQRIAIARALLSNKDVIIFDEATSALDNISERKVKEIIKNNNKIIISIAHRLNTIKDSDKIYVIDNGKIKESGNHNELLDKNGLYAKLYRGN